nr:MAG TPA: hypothetical protein [Caudoviricetes sp.]
MRHLSAEVLEIHSVDVVDIIVCGVDLLSRPIRMDSLSFYKEGVFSSGKCPKPALVLCPPKFNRPYILLWLTSHPVYGFNAGRNIEVDCIRSNQTAFVNIFSLDSIQQNPSQNGNMICSCFLKIAGVLFRHHVIERHNMGEHSHTPFHGIGDPYWTNTAPQQMQERLVLPVPLSWPAVRSHLRSGMSWTSFQRSGFAAPQPLQRLRSFGGHAEPLCWQGRCSGTVPQWRSMPFSRHPVPGFEPPDPACSNPKSCLHAGRGGGNPARRWPSPGICLCNTHNLRKPSGASLLLRTGFRLSLRLKRRSSKAKFHHTGIINKHFKGIVLGYSEYDVGIKRDVLLCRGAVFLEGHF